MNKDFIKGLINEEVTSIEEIHAGISNTSYLVNDKYVVRIKNNAERFYSADHERTIMKKISSLNISERLINLDDTGNKVSEYIPNVVTFAPNPITVKEVANLLKALHTSNVRTLVHFKPFKRYHYYQKHSGETVPFKHEEIVIKKVKKMYHHSKYVLCHNDVVDNNLLFSNKKSYLIDYEFAGMNIAEFDLASFISENNIKDQRLVELFINTYHATDQQIANLPYMIMFLNLLWYYWAKYRYLETKESVYEKIFNEKKTHIEDDMRSLLIY